MFLKLKLKYTDTNYKCLFNGLCVYNPFAFLNTFWLSKPILIIATVSGISLEGVE